MGYELPDDHPLLHALRRSRPGTQGVFVDDPYILIAGDDATKTITRYAMSPELREALTAHERGEDMPLGRFELLVPHLKLDATGG